MKAFPIRPTNTLPILGMPHFLIADLIGQYTYESYTTYILKEKKCNSKLLHCLMQLTCNNKIQMLRSS